MEATYVDWALPERFEDFHERQRPEGTLHEKEQTRLFRGERADILWFAHVVDNVILRSNARHKIYKRL